MRRPFEILAAGAVLGELIAWAGISVAAVILITAGLGVLLFRASDETLRKRGCLFLTAFLLYFGRFLWGMTPGKQELALDARCGKETVLSLKIAAVETREKGLMLICPGVLVSVPETGGDAESEAFHIGDRVTVRGMLSRIEHATNPGEFDFAAYYRARGITHRVSVREILGINRERRTAGDRWKEGMRRARDGCIRRLYLSCPEEDAGFLGAALFGVREGLSDEWYDLYRRNGIAHLLAISGLHAALLGLGLYRMLRKLGLGFGLSGAVAGGCLMLYSLLTGSGTGVTRAVFMLLLAFTAAALGRNYDLRSALGAAALGLLWCAPLELFQCGFQLSFLAVFAIGGPASALLRIWQQGRETRFKKKKRGDGFFPLLWERWGYGVRCLPEQLLVSTVIFLVTLPVLAYWFFAVPPYSILINLLVIPLMGLLLWAGLAALAFGGGTCAGLQVIARAAAGAVHGILRFYHICCETAEHLPGHSILIGRPRLWQIACYYLLLLSAYGLMITGGVRLRRRLRGASCALLLLLAICSIRPIHSAVPRIWFLDIGQGDSIVIECGDSCVTIDGGSTSKRGNGRYILKPFLESRGIRHIEAAFITHADIDHTNGMEYLLREAQEFRIDRLLLTAAAEADGIRYESLKEAARGRAETALVYFGAGDQLGCFRCLWPVRGTVPEEVNEHSLILLFSFGETRCLFTGDAGKDNEEALLLRLRDDPKLQAALSDIDILKVGHHGSGTASSRDFLALLRPKIAVLSYGKRNRYGHPHPDTVERLKQAGARLRCTAEEGAICLETKQKY